MVGWRLRPVDGGAFRHSLGEWIELDLLWITQRNVDGDAEVKI